MILRSSGSPPDQSIGRIDFPCKPPRGPQSGPLHYGRILIALGFIALRPYRSWARWLLPLLDRELGAMAMMVETCHMYLAIIKAITDAVAQSAVEHSGENLFRVEAQLLRNRNCC